MSNFQDAVHKLSEWLKNENNQQLILKGNLFDILTHIIKDLGIMASIIYFNIECDRKGKDNILSKFESIPDFLLLSHYFSDDIDLTLNKVQIISNSLTREFLSSFNDIQRRFFKKVRIKDLISGSSYNLNDSIFINKINVSTMEVDTCDYQNTLEDLARCCLELHVNKIDDNNPFLTVTFKDSMSCTSISLPENINYITKECFSNLTHGINIYINSKSDISFQKGCFNHNTNHIIHIPNGTQVRCHKEDKEYLRKHIQRY